MNASLARATCDRCGIRLGGAPNNPVYRPYVEGFPGAWWTGDPEDLSDDAERRRRELLARAASTGSIFRLCVECYCDDPAGGDDEVCPSELPCDEWGGIVWSTFQEVWPPDYLDPVELAARHPISGRKLSSPNVEPRAARVRRTLLDLVD